MQCLSGDKMVIMITITFPLFQDYEKLFPIFHYGREYLQQVTGESTLMNRKEVQIPGKNPSLIYCCVALGRALIRGLYPDWF